MGLVEVDVLVVPERQKEGAEGDQACASRPSRAKLGSLRGWGTPARWVESSQIMASGVGIAWRQ